jgi:hypothetical protein
MGLILQLRAVRARGEVRGSDMPGDTRSFVAFMDRYS